MPPAKVRDWDRTGERGMGFGKGKGDSSGKWFDVALGSPRQIVQSNFQQQKRLNDFFSSVFRGTTREHGQTKLRQ